MVSKDSATPNEPGLVVSSDGKTADPARDTGQEPARGAPIRPSSTDTGSSAKDIVNELLADPEKINRAGGLKVIFGDYVLGEKIDKSIEAGRDVALGEVVRRPDDGKQLPSSIKPTPQFTGDFYAWRKTAQPQTLCLILSIAALHGESYAIIQEAADELGELLGISLDAEGKRRFEPFDVAGDSISSILEPLGAYRADKIIDSYYGSEPRECVLFEDPDWADVVLKSSWVDVRRLSTKMAPWLVELGRHRMHSVRVRAGQSAGVLLSADWPTVAATIIKPWTTGSKSVRWTAARAFVAAASNPAQLPTVRDFLLSLAKGNWGEAGVGTAALSLGVGLSRLDAKFCSTLTSQLCSNWSMLDGALVLGALNLLEDLEADTRLAEPMITGLADWLGWQELDEIYDAAAQVSTSDLIASTQSTGSLETVEDILAFMTQRRAASKRNLRDLEEDPPFALMSLVSLGLLGQWRLDDQMETDRWPAPLLALAASSPHLASSIAKVLLRTQRLPKGRLATSLLLRSWIKTASHKPDAALGVAKVFACIHSQGREKDQKRLTNWIRKWGTDTEVRAGVEAIASNFNRAQRFASGEARND